LVDNSAFLKTCSSSIVVLLFITKIYTYETKISIRYLK
jgi:hypothetical protein